MGTKTSRKNRRAEYTARLARPEWGALPIVWVDQSNEMHGIRIDDTLWHRQADGTEWLGVILRDDTLLGFVVSSRGRTYSR